MDILMLGGKGFIGSRLERMALQQGVDMTIADVGVGDDDDKSIFVDVTDFSTFKNIGNVETIINLAAVHADDVKPVSKYDSVNVDGARNICRFAELHNVKKIIFTSSVAVYGFTEIPTGENGEINFFNDYGRSKYEAELVYRRWADEDPERRTLVIVRPTVVFGEGNRGNVYNLLRQIASKRYVMIGNGKNIKSLAYVENVAAFLLHSLTFGRGTHVYNYVDSPQISVAELVLIARKSLFEKDNLGIKIPIFLGLLVGGFFDVIAALCKRTFPISKLRVRKFCSSSHFLSEVGCTGFVPPVDLVEALNKTIAAEFKS